MIDNHTTQRRGFRSLRRPLAVGTLLVGTLGAGALLAAAASPDHLGWRSGMRIEHMQHMAARMLDSVGATSAQEAKVHDIIAAASGDVQPDGQARQAMRTQVLALLRAPTIDRDAVERLRADQVARFDSMSKRVVTAALDAADQLTADQRTKLADRFEAMMLHRASMGGGWGDQRGPDEGRGTHSMDGGARPDDDAPRSGSDGG